MLLPAPRLCLPHMLQISNVAKQLDYDYAITLVDAAARQGPADAVASASTNRPAGLRACAAATHDTHAKAQESRASWSSPWPAAAARSAYETASAQACRSRLMFAAWRAAARNAPSACIAPLCWQAADWSVLKRQIYHSWPNCGLRLKLAIPTACLDCRLSSVKTQLGGCSSTPVGAQKHCQQAAPEGCVLQTAQLPRPCRPRWLRLEAASQLPCSPDQVDACPPQGALLHPCLSVALKQMGILGHLAMRCKLPACLQEASTTCRCMR